MRVVVDDDALRSLLQVNGVFQLRLAAIPAVLRAALELQLIAAGAGAREGDENHEVRLVPSILCSGLAVSQFFFIF